jgi:hypothetical protein
MKCSGDLPLIKMKYETGASSTPERNKKSFILGASSDEKIGR